MTTGCATEIGFEVGYEFVDSVLSAWGSPVLVLGAAFVLAAVVAALGRRLDPPSRGLLLGVGLLLVLGTVLVTGSLEYLVMHGVLDRTCTSCPV